jgi:hypothetical protein
MWEYYNAQRGNEKWLASRNTGLEGVENVARDFGGVLGESGRAREESTTMSTKKLIMVPFWRI